MSTDDVSGLAAAEGMLTAAGGRTSHAAVVARQMGKVCLVGCADLHVDERRRRCTIAGRGFAEGDFLSLDGNTGHIYAERLEVVRERPEEALACIARWRGAAAKGTARL